MNACRLVQATPGDVDAIVTFITVMGDELKEFTLQPDIVKQSISRSFSENVFWFLFMDADDVPFGVCHLQSVHSYWRLEKRFHMGGFYIAPSHRGQGYFRQINEQLVNWVKARGGVQIYAHIHKDNEKSIRSFESVGLKEIDYRLYVHHWGD